MERALARKKSSSSLHRTQSELGSSAPSSTTPSEQKLREEKSTPYTHARYEVSFATKGSYMDKDEAGVREREQRTLPKSSSSQFLRISLFGNDLFESLCRMVRNKNEARVMRDISQLLVPSAEVLFLRGAKHLKILMESVNEGWNNSIPLT